MKRKRPGRLFALAVLLAVCFAIVTGAALQQPTYSGDGIHDLCGDAVVYVRSLTAKGTLKTSGTGFLISEDGRMLTASHVVSKGVTVNVVLPSGEELENIPVLLRDDLTDVAILQLPEREGGYPYLTIREEIPKTGEDVYAIGYPLKTTRLMTDGIVANRKTLINGTERTLVSADFASGMSGGPILDCHGQVVGICSATILTMNGASASPTVEQIQSVINQLETETEKEMET